ncbi:MAG: hypothetical protein HY674_08390 [Chloroflexi bacterium]|nr:hypothetical protein [Chloroflexota bacterium]
MQRKDISEAVEEFVDGRKAKAKAKDGKRSQLSPVYAANVGMWLHDLTRPQIESPPNASAVKRFLPKSQPGLQLLLKPLPRSPSSTLDRNWQRFGNALLERFEELSEKAIRRGSFVSVPDLHEAIDRFWAAWNQKPKPFIWTATVEDMIKKIARARAKLEEIKPGCTQPTGKKKADVT